MDLPVISIITVTYNACPYLEKTVESVVTQTCREIEYIIIDGKSTDETIDIIKKHSENISFWISEKDNGLYDAMNKGINTATGRYVWFLNAGDILPNKNIACDITEIIKKNNYPDILFGETNLINEQGYVFSTRRLKAPRELNWKSFRMGMLVSHQAFLAKRSIIPLYDLKYRFSSDFDWCIRCMKKAESVINSNLTLVNYQYEGLTTSNRKASLKERYEIMCKYYGVIPTQIRHIWFAVRFYWAKYTKKII